MRQKKTNSAVPFKRLCTFLIRSIGTKEAITRRFFLIFEFQSSYDGNRKPKEKEVYQYMRTTVQTAKKYLAICGNVVLEHENESRFCVELFYQLLNRRTSVTVPFSERIKLVTQWYPQENGKESLPHIPVTELFAPKTLNFKHRNCVVFEWGISYLFVYSFWKIPNASSGRLDFSDYQCGRRN